MGYTDPSNNKHSVVTSVNAFRTANKSVSSMQQIDMHNLYFH